MIHKRAGAAVFFRGLPATVGRDVVFGGIFSSLRQSIRSRVVSCEHLGAAQVQFAADFVAAGVATTVSAPLNFARNVQFAGNLREPAPSTRSVLAELVREMPQGSKGIRFLLQRCAVGWGTLRVAGGMALTARIFGVLVAHGRQLES